MKRRHQGRTVLAVLAAAGLISSGILVSSTPAAAATTKVAGTGIAKTGGTPLNMRKSPSSSSARVGTVANGGKVWIMCQVAGDNVSGTVRTTRMWNRLANNSYVSDAYVVRSGFTVPSCSAASPATPAAGAWTLPLSCGAGGARGPGGSRPRP